jgi:hypothetical protein
MPLRRTAWALVGFTLVIGGCASSRGKRAALPEPVACNFGKDVDRPTTDLRSDLVPSPKEPYRVVVDVSQRSKPIPDDVESALVRALSAAAEAGRFDLVVQLAKELEARRIAVARNVVPIGQAGPRSPR